MRPVPAWRQLEFAAPTHIPSMISAEEKQFLAWLTRHCWKGRGHVVEMGPWLGGSTACLAAGMRANPKREEWKLHVYDMFVWRDYMAERYPLPIAIGESFEPCFVENLREHAELLCVHNASLTDEAVEGDALASSVRETGPGASTPVAWECREPVEILFVDGAKSWTGLRQLLREFGPYLTDEGARIVFQDFKYWGAYWVAAIAQFFSDRLTIEHILEHNTVAFRVTAPLTREDIDALPTWQEIGGEQCAALQEAAAIGLERLGDAAGAAIVRLGMTRMWMHEHQPERANACFRESERSWPLLAEDANLSEARIWLEGERGERIRQLSRTRLRRLLLPVARLVRRLAALS